MMFTKPIRFLLLLSFLLMTNVHAQNAEPAMDDYKAELAKFLQSKGEDTPKAFKVHREDIKNLELQRLIILPGKYTDTGFVIGSASKNNVDRTFLVYKDGETVGLFYARLEAGKCIGDSFGFEELAKQFGAVQKQFPNKKVTFFSFMERPLYGFLMGGMGAEKPTLTLFSSVKDWNNIQPLPYNIGLKELDQWKDYKGGAAQSEPTTNE